ncbi:hypothetical protein [Saccharothrix algeriensis]|uniref:hypothetical protein n=1 Tax=Saccharothrix algeriensis TaxID=173560 RepID=UPI00195CBB66|nr:hypothetical protein [Saccharothrix algeriensis]
MTASLPIRVAPLAFAGRVEVRFGNAFPTVLVVDHEALPRLAAAIAEGLAALDAAGGDQCCRGSVVSWRGRQPKWLITWKAGPGVT